MAQEERGVPEAAAVESIGRYLARQRLLRGISLDDLAVLTRIPRRSLERLEAGAFDREPDGFARGFVRTVAGALGLDPDEAVLRLMKEPPGDDPVGAAGAAGVPRGILGGLVLVLAIVVVALLVWNLQPLVAEPSAEAPGSEIVYRRDAVRALDAERGGPRAPRAAMRPGGGPPPEGDAASR
ncbi:MAG: helix-turn-helix domain-containing protein [Myxococcales bacterium]|nr:helix-turn-helix domain-containing protein [Myxococcales bacterium]